MIHLINKDADVAFTTAWWERTIKDEAKLILWLQKLQQTEIGGYDDYMVFIRQFEPEERTRKIFSNIADDELKHSGLIVDLLEARGYRNSLDDLSSTYWATMNENIIDLKTAAAVNYFGEALAAFRFEVIAEHKETPGDIKELLSKVLPDEQFHRETLKRIAGNDLLESMAEKHHRAVAELRGKK